jgi:hypothetical protein
MDQRVDMNQQARMTSGLNVILSIWLIASPFLLSFAGAFGMWNAIVVGVIVLVLSWLRFNNPATMPWLSWITALLGVWLIASPFLFGMSGVTALLWDYIAVGVGFVVFGAWSALATHTTTS